MIGLFMKIYLNEPIKILQFLSRGKTSHKKFVRKLRHILTFLIISHLQADSRIYQGIFLRYSCLYHSSTKKRCIIFILLVKQNFNQQSININYSLKISEETLLFIKHINVISEKVLRYTIPVRKVLFRVFDKLKNEIQNSRLRFCFYFNAKNEIQIIDCYFHV